MVVHPDHPDAQLARDARALEAVARPHRGAEAGVAVVGPHDDLVLALRGLQEDHRARDLLARDAHRGGHAGQDGRGVEGAGQPGKRDPPAAVKRRARRDGVVHELLHAVGAVARDERADLGGGVQRVAEPARPGGPDQAVEEAARPRPRRTARAHARAALPGVGERGPGDAGRGAARLASASTSIGVLAAELERAALQPAGAGLADLAPGAGRAGEADLGDEPRGHQRGADVAVAVHHAEQALRQPGAGEDARDALAAERGVRRRLEHDAVARHERDGDVAQRRGERLGGRAQHGDDAERLVGPAAALDRMLRCARSRPARRPRIPGPCSASHCSVSIAGRSSMISASASGRPCSRPTSVHELVGLVDDRLGGPGHVARAVGRAQLRPQPLDPCGLGDRGRDVARARGRDAAQRLAGGRARATPGERGRRPSPADHATCWRACSTRAARRRRATPGARSSSARRISGVGSPSWLVAAIPHEPLCAVDPGRGAHHTPAAQVEAHEPVDVHVVEHEARAGGRDPPRRRDPSCRGSGGGPGVRRRGDGSSKASSGLFQDRRTTVRSS